MRRIVGLALCFAASVEAACVTVSPGDDLQAALDAVPRRGCVNLSAGAYAGPVVISRAMTVTGEAGTVIEGGARAVTIAASRVTLRGLTVRGSGRRTEDADAAVYLKKFTHDVRLEDVTLAGPAHGLYGEGVARVRLVRSRVSGDASRPVTSRGDGVYMKSSGDVTVSGSHFENVRDGVYFESTEGCRAVGNDVVNAQYGVHFMYTKGDEARDNRVTRSLGGIAVMSTRQAQVTENLVEDGVEVGILLNVADGCTVTKNTLRRIHNSTASTGLNSEGKALFIYGAGKNMITWNRFEESDIGLEVALGGEGSVVFGNSITGNQTSARYAGLAPLTWSRRGVGNFWGEGVVWDLDGDARADAPYQPNDSLDRLFWIYPEARFLAESPVVFLLRRVTAGLALDAGKGITDETPLLKRPPEAGCSRGEKQ